MKKRIWGRNKKDFKFDWFNGSGAGGQYRNKVANCLRLTDKETGLTVTAQSSRSRLQNTKDAFNRLVDKLIEFYNKKEVEERINTPSFGKESTRTYHECDNRVTDHVTGEKYSFAHTVGKGDLSLLIEDRIRYFNK